jgi:multidrug efflux pump subunit AcrA (membrane-fusion protein)
MKRKWFKRIGIILIIVIIVAAGIVGVRIWKGKKKMQAGVAKQSTVTLTKMDLTDSISATGTLASKETRSVSADVNNITIEKMLVSVGDEVEKGDSLATFDETELQDALTTAKENLSDTQTSANQEISNAQEQYSEALSNQSYDKSKMDTQVQKAVKEKAEAKKAVATAKAQVKKLKNSKDEQKKTAAQETLTKAQEAYEQAKNSVETAKENRSSTNRQNKSSVTQAKTSLENARSNASKSIKEAQNQVDEAQDAIDNCGITAPISGVVTAVNAQAGDTYTGGTLVQIDDTSAYTITTSVDEYDISSVEVGQRVVILTEATDDDELEGKITFVAPSTDSTSDTTSSESGGQAGGSSSSSGYEVKIKVKSQDDRLKMGLTAKCSIILDEVTDVYAVPYDAVSENPDGSYYITVLDTDATSQDTKEETKQDASSENQQMPGGDDGQNSKGDKKGKGDSEEMQAATRQITVTKGMETDYYAEISGDDLEEGLQVVVPTDATESSSSDSNSDSTMGFGNMGGMGGGQGGGDMGGGGNNGGFGGGAPGGGK